MLNTYYAGITDYDGYYGLDFYVFRTEGDDYYWEHYIYRWCEVVYHGCGHDGYDPFPRGTVG